MAAVAGIQSTGRLLIGAPSGMAVASGIVRPLDQGVLEITEQTLTA